MIRVVMLGRLGNNLFQYAFGRMLAEKHGVPLVMDASWFNNRTWPYVQPLGLLPGFRSGKARLDRPFSPFSRALGKLTGKHRWEYLGLPVVREAPGNHSFDGRLLDATADCVIFGYFQTHLYFSGLEEELRAELATDGLGLERGHDALAVRLREPGSVAVHVRRTDYINNHNLASLGSEYYRRAMDHLRQQVGNCSFFIFSDDPGWCQEHFREADITVLTHSDPFSPLEDLHLMSIASHHIIANSSYSWWAAWLGKAEGQMVLMPDRWFIGDIIAPISEKQCSGWTIIETD